MIKMRNDVIILGRPIQLQERKKAQMKGVTIGDSLAYKFFDGEYHGMSLLFAEPKGKVAPPRSLAITASNLASLFKLPVVFLLPNCPAYERQRLIDKAWLNPDSERMIMMPVKQLREFKSSGVLVRPNEFDGNIIIEAWKYPPVTAIGTKAEWVDRLSLAISLSEDEDPRVEGEVERLINEIEWKD